MFATVFFLFFPTGVQPDGGDEEQRSKTVLLEDVDFNEKKNSSPRSSQFREDVCTKKRRTLFPIENGQANEQADVEKVVEKPKKRARTGKPGTGAASVSKGVTKKSEGLQIGQRIEALFDDPPEYFPGTITGKDKGRWQIEYDDGDREELDLSTTGRMNRKYRLLRGEGLIAGPKAHKAAIPTKRKGTRPARMGLTLLDLIKEGLMEPGQGVLRVEYKGHVFLGDLTPSGSICYEGELWESPTS